MRNKSSEISLRDSAWLHITVDDAFFTSILIAPSTGEEAINILPASEYLNRV